MKVKRITFLCWVVPLSILVGVGLLYYAGASEVTRAQLKRLLAEEYGLSEETLESYLSRLPEGWRIGDPVELSLPQHEHEWLAELSSVEEGVTLVFAHLGDGALRGTNLSFKTTYCLLNGSQHSATGNIAFYNDDGNPMELTIDGVTASSFPISLAGRGVSSAS